MHDDLDSNDEFEEGGGGGGDYAMPDVAPVTRASSGAGASGAGGGGGGAAGEPGVGEASVSGAGSGVGFSSRVTAGKPGAPVAVADSSSSAGLAFGVSDADSDLAALQLAQRQQQQAQQQQAQQQLADQVRALQAQQQALEADLGRARRTAEGAVASLTERDKDLVSARATAAASQAAVAAQRREAAVRSLACWASGRQTSVLARAMGTWRLACAVGDAQGQHAAAAAAQRDVAAVRRRCAELEAQLVLRKQEAEQLRAASQQAAEAQAVASASAVEDLSAALARSRTDASSLATQLDQATRRADAADAHAASLSEQLTQSTVRLREAEAALATLRDRTVASSVAAGDLVKEAAGLTAKVHAVSLTGLVTAFGGLGSRLRLRQLHRAVASWRVFAERAKGAVGVQYTEAAVQAATSAASAAEAARAAVVADLTSVTLRLRECEAALSDMTARAERAEGRTTGLFREAAAVKATVQTRVQRAAASAMATWLSFRQRASVSDALRTWQRLTIEGRCDVLARREVALRSALEQVQGQLEAACQDDAVRAVLEQRATILSLEAQLAQAQDAIRRQHVEFGLGHAGGGYLGSQAPVALPPPLPQGTPALDRLTYADRTSDRFLELVDAACEQADATVVAPLEKRVAVLEEMLAERDEQVFRLVQAAGVASTLHGDDKRRHAAEMLVSEVRQAQQREAALLDRLTMRELGPAVGRANEAPPGPQGYRDPYPPPAPT